MTISSFTRPNITFKCYSSVLKVILVFVCFILGWVRCLSFEELCKSEFDPRACGSLGLYCHMVTDPATDNPFWMRWAESRDYCRNFGGDLVSIHSDEERDFVHGLATGSYYLISYDHYFWVGLNDVTSQGQWAWSDSSTYDYQEWRNDVEPFSLGRCACVEPTDNSYPKDWMYFGCTSVNLFAICRVNMLRIMSEKYEKAFTYEWEFCDKTGDESMKLPSTTDFADNYDHVPLYPSRRTGSSHASYEGGFYLFGGFSNGTKGDLWHMSLTEEWTFLSVHPSQRGWDFPSNVTLYPGSRVSVGILYLDSPTRPKLLLFGGQGVNSAVHSDLWLYDILDGEWNLVDTVPLSNYTNQYGKYGDEEEHPGSRYRPVMVSYYTKEVVVLFGGQSCYGETEIGNCGDLWTYNLSSNTWNFSGDSVTRGVDFSSSGTYPGATTSQETGWIEDDAFFLFHSDGVLWCYDLISSGSDWKIVSSSPASSSTVWHPPSDDTPGKRASALITHLPNTHYTLLFGGDGVGFGNNDGIMGDLWLIGARRIDQWNFESNFIQLVAKDFTLVDEMMKVDFPYSHTNYPSARTLGVFASPTPTTSFLFGGGNPSFGKFGDLYRLNTSFVHCINVFPLLPTDHESELCSGIGTCRIEPSTKMGSCDCNQKGVFGTSCDNYTCGFNSSCGGHGVCSEAGCTDCEEGYGGVNCNPICEPLIQFENFQDDPSNKWVLTNVETTDTCGSYSSPNSAAFRLTDETRYLKSAHDGMLLNPLNYVPRLPLKVKVSFMHQPSTICNTPNVGQRRTWLRFYSEVYTNHPATNSTSTHQLDLMGEYRAGEWQHAEYDVVFNTGFRFQFTQELPAGTGYDVYLVDDFKVVVHPDHGYHDCGSKHDRGECVGPNICRCKEGWAGEFCHLPTCFGFLENDTLNVCNGWGQCVDKDVCACFSGSFGEKCDVFNCYGLYTNESGACSGNGLCVGKDSCYCDHTPQGGVMWEGDECDTRICFGIPEQDKNVCSRHGECVYPDTCDCENNYFSRECKVCIKEHKFREWSTKKQVELLYYVKKEDIVFDNPQKYFNGTASFFNCSLIVANWKDYFFFKSSECSFTTIKLVGLEITSELVLQVFDYSKEYMSEDELNSKFYELVDETESMNIEIRLLTSATETQTVSTPVPIATDKQQPKTKNNPATVILSVVLGSVTFLVSLICCCCCVSVCCVVSCFCGFLCFGGFFSAPIFSCILRCFWYQKRKLKRFGVIEDFQLLLKEQEDGEKGARLTINKELFELNFDEIVVDKVLTDGGSEATVFKATWNGSDVAFKCFKTKMVTSSEEDYYQFEAEVSLMASLNHPNMVRFYGATLKPPRVGIVMEFCESGDILEFFGRYEKESNKKYPLKEKIRMASEIASCVDYLHDHKVIHRDLKAENVLVDIAEQCKLIDFGVSRIIKKKGEQVTKAVGTNSYMAPEVLKRVYDERVDIFSYGILLYVMMTENRKPYEEYDGVVDRIELRVAADPSFRPSMNNWKENLSKNYGHEEAGRKKCSTILKDIIIGCWDENPNERPEFKDMIRIFDDLRQRGAQVSTEGLSKSTELFADNDGEKKGTHSNRRLKEERKRLLEVVEELKSEIGELEVKVRNIVQERLDMRKKVIQEQQEEELRKKFEQLESTGPRKSSTVRRPVSNIWTRKKSVPPSIPRIDSIRKKKVMEMMFRRSGKNVWSPEKKEVAAAPNLTTSSGREGFPKKKSAAAVKPVPSKQGRAIISQVSQESVPPVPRSSKHHHHDGRGKAAPPVPSSGKQGGGKKRVLFSKKPTTTPPVPIPSKQGRENVPVTQEVAGGQPQVPRSRQSGRGKLAPPVPRSMKQSRGKVAPPVPRSSSSSKQSGRGKLASPVPRSSSRQSGRGKLAPPVPGSSKQSGRGKLAPPVPRSSKRSGRGKVAPPPPSSGVPTVPSSSSPKEEVVYYEEGEEVYYEEGTEEVYYEEPEGTEEGYFDEEGRFCYYEYYDEGEGV